MDLAISKEYNQSLEATLLAIIFIYDIYISLLEQDHQEGVGIQELYKMYEMYKIYKKYKELWNRWKVSK